MQAGLGGFLKGLFPGQSKSEGRGNSIARWAQSMTAGCEKASLQPPPNMELATFGGGCFWGLELKFQRVPGVHKTSVGYANGQTADPTYEAVCSGQTGYTEAVQVVYDPKECSFRQLLEAYTQQTDLTTKNRQGGDRGTQYRSGVYYHNEEQKAEAEAFFKEVNAQLAEGKPPMGRKNKMEGGEVVAELEPVQDYYYAEGYHQQYLSKGGRFGMGQSAEKGCTDPIRCYG